MTHMIVKTDKPVTVREDAGNLSISTTQSTWFFKTVGEARKFHAIHGGEIMKLTECMEKYGHIY